MPFCVAVTVIAGKITLHAARDLIRRPALAQAVLHILEVLLAIHLATLRPGLPEKETVQRLLELLAEKGRFSRLVDVSEN